MSKYVDFKAVVSDRHSTTKSLLMYYAGGIITVTSVRRDSDSHHDERK